MSTKAVLLKSALEEVLTHGVGGARVDRIACRAGVNKRMIYHYFKNREGICEAVLFQQLGVLASEKAPFSSPSKAIFRDFYQVIEADRLRIDLPEAELDVQTGADYRRAAGIFFRGLLGFDGLGVPSIKALQQMLDSLDAVQWPEFAAELLASVYLSRSPEGINSSVPRSEGKGDERAENHKALRKIPAKFRLS